MAPSQCWTWFVLHLPYLASPTSTWRYCFVVIQANLRKTYYPSTSLNFSLNMIIWLNILYFSSSADESNSSSSEEESPPRSRQKKHRKRKESRARYSTSWTYNKTSEYTWRDSNIHDILSTCGRIGVVSSLCITDCKQKLLIISKSQAKGNLLVPLLTRWNLIPIPISGFHFIMSCFQFWLMTRLSLP